MSDNTAIPQDVLELRDMLRPLWGQFDTGPLVCETPEGGDGGMEAAVAGAVEASAPTAETQSAETSAETPVEPAAETSTETPAEVPVEPGAEVPDPLEQIRLAAEIAQDPTDEQYELAVQILQQNGLPVPEVEQLEFEADDDDAPMTKGEWKAWQEQQQAAAEEQAAVENYYNDLSEQFNDGQPFPRALADMTPDQQLAAAAAIGLNMLTDGAKDASDVKALLKARDEALVTQAKKDYLEGKEEPRVVPITDRNASHTAPAIKNVEQTVADITREKFRTAGG